MTGVELPLALFLLANLAVAIVCAACGPTPADRTLVALLFGSTGVAILWSRNANTCRRFGLRPNEVAFGATPYTSGHGQDLRERVRGMASALSCGRA